MGAAVLSTYLACNVGANDVANSMGTSVGSGALTLRRALAIAAVMEVGGAVLLGSQVSHSLVTDVISPSVFVDRPQVWLLGMMTVLLATALWLNVANLLKLPVSSSHAVVGAIAGFGWSAAGLMTVHWSFVGLLSLTWVATPVVSAALAAVFYGLVQRWIMQQAEPMRQLAEWIPWLSVAVFGVFGAIALPGIAQMPGLAARLPVGLPPQDLGLGLGGLASLWFTLRVWRSLCHDQSQPQFPRDSAPATAPTPGQTPLESGFCQFKVVSACFVAFAHGSNDVGNAIAPLGAIAYGLSTGRVPLDGFDLPLWVLWVGAGGIVLGLTLWGGRVITTVGSTITVLQPSGGFCAELATAVTVLLASRAGLAVSTSHALIGAVVGVGLIHRDPIQRQTVGAIALAWGVTIPVTALFSAGLFAIARAVFAVP